MVCAQSIGAQNLERANRAANQLLYIVTAAALGIMVLVLFCKAGLLGLLFGQVEPEVMEGAVTYFVISALSYPFIAVYNGCAALLRAMGNSKASMCVSAYMNGQNIAGNAVFVFVFHQGVAGVALSSLLSRIAAAGLMLALLHGRRNPVRVSGLLRFRFEPAVMAQILRIGVPNSLENKLLSTGPGAAGEPASPPSARPRPPPTPWLTTSTISASFPARPWALLSSPWWASVWGPETGIRCAPTPSGWSSSPTCVPGGSTLRCCWVCPSSCASTA